MRAVINKGIEEHHLFTSVDLGAAAHILNFKLYIMVGLPFEADEDIDAIIDLTQRLRSYMDEKGCRGTLTLSVNPFVPKPFTPFQWMAAAEKKRMDAVMKRLTQALSRHKKIVVHFESPKEARVPDDAGRKRRQRADHRAAALASVLNRSGFLDRALEVCDQVLGAGGTGDHLDELPPVGAPLVKNCLRRVREQRNR